MDCGVLGQLKWERSVGGREGKGEGAEGCSRSGLRVKGDDRVEEKNAGHSKCFNRSA